MHLMTWLTDEVSPKMLLDIHFPLNNVINDQLGFYLVDVYFDIMPHILCKYHATYIM